jgi:hypothetical protein
MSEIPEERRIAMAGGLLWQINHSATCIAELVDQMKPEDFKDATETLDRFAGYLEEIHHTFTPAEKHDA